MWQDIKTATQICPADLTGFDFEQFQPVDVKYRHTPRDFWF